MTIPDNGLLGSFLAFVWNDNGFTSAEQREGHLEAGSRQNCGVRNTRGVLRGSHSASCRSLQQCPEHTGDVVTIHPPAITYGEKAEYFIRASCALEVFRASQSTQILERGEAEQLIHYERFRSLVCLACYCVLNELNHWYKYLPPDQYLELRASESESESERERERARGQVQGGPEFRLLVSSRLVPRAETNACCVATTGPGEAVQWRQAAPRTPEDLSSITGLTVLISGEDGAEVECEAGKTGDSRENPHAKATSAMFPMRENPDGPVGIEPGSPWWKACSLATKPLLSRVATVAQQLKHSPPTKATWVRSPIGTLPPRVLSLGNRAGRCQWSAGFLGDLQFTLSLHSGSVPYSPRFILIGSQDLYLKNRSDLSTPLLRSKHGQVIRARPQWTKRPGVEDGFDLHKNGIKFLVSEDLLSNNTHLKCDLTDLSSASHNQSKCGSACREARSFKARSLDIPQPNI
ncbi:hypothetical protein PR048_029288 [Dryococelus australis]|uniref:Ig-like domain-containing protein n=1 Tax=Dryococelus australis TaxID=614101 RepID=A0ABQ9GFM4_9NEOP|nr:hypothetical protein PR048_029288 [Dryococelus australis]